MSERKDLIETLVEMLKEFNAGCVQVNFDEYHIIACTDEAYTVMSSAYNEWMNDEDISK